MSPLPLITPLCSFSGLDRQHGAILCCAVEYSTRMQLSAFALTAPLDPLATERAECQSCLSPVNASLDRIVRDASTFFRSLPPPPAPRRRYDGLGVSGSNNGCGGRGLTCRNRTVLYCTVLHSRAGTLGNLQPAGPSPKHLLLPFRIRVETAAAWHQGLA